MNTGPGHSAHGPSSLPNWWPADPRHTSTSTSDVMSQLCRVCGEPAAGFHFGAFTCEGCKSFFGRTYNNLSSISECKNNGECVINKKNRTSCKACRLRKCLVVGMSKSGSRYGRRSNWFKIHCLLQEQQQHHHQHQQQQHQQQHQQHLQSPQHPVQNAQQLGLAGGLQHFQHHVHQRSLQAGRPSSQDPGLTPPPWADVKHHLRLDADNNNSVAGDLNKQDLLGGRLSAAAAVVQAVRPELLRWPSPFFPAFPFPPPAPFFLALQQQQHHQHQHQQQHHQQPPPHGPRSSSSPASRSSRSAVEDEDDDGGGGGGGGGGDDGQPAPKRVAVGRELPPVQESPMDLSVSAAVPPPPPPSSSSSPRPPPSPSPSASSSASASPSSSRSASPSDGGRGVDNRSSADRPSSRHGRHHRRRKRTRRRRRRGPEDAARGTSGSDSDGSGSGSRRRRRRRRDGSAADGRPAKNVPLDLTCNRS